MAANDLVNMGIVSKSFIIDSSEDIWEELKRMLFFEQISIMMKDHEEEEKNQK